MAADTDGTDETTIRVNGTLLEGGGQVIRQSIGLGAILRHKIQFVQIRGKRPRPGLQRQHMTGVDLVARLSNSEIDGAYLDSTELLFSPREDGGIHCFSGTIEADTKSAGAICLLIQVALPVALFSPGPVEMLLKGGTNAAHAPQVDYAKEVFLPVLSEQCRVEGLELDVERRGYYPKGGGIVRLRTKPVESLHPIELVDRGHLKKIRIRAFVAGVIKKHVGERMAKSARECAERGLEKLGVDMAQVEIEEEVVEEGNCWGTACGIIVVATTSTGCRIAGSELGERGITAEVVGGKAATQLVEVWKMSKSCVDEYLQDQLVIFAVLAQGVSRIRCGPLSLHTQTAIHFARHISGCRIEVTPEDSTNLITIHGIGRLNQRIDQVDPIEPPAPIVSTPSGVPAAGTSTRGRGGGRGRRRRKRGRS